MSILIIAALAKNNAIGKDNAMLWHISEDLKYFKKLTSKHPVIMGSKTFLSLGGKPLPNRRNIVVSRKEEAGLKEGVEFFNDLDKAIKSASEYDDEIFIIGGGQLYKQAVRFADKLYITEVDAVIEDADTFFPAIDLNIWQEASRSEKMHDKKSGYYFQFVTYLRK